MNLNIMAGGYAEKKERDFNRERRRSDREEWQPDQVTTRRPSALHARRVSGRTCRLTGFCFYRQLRSHQPAEMRRQADPCSHKGGNGARIPAASTPAADTDCLCVDKSRLFNSVLILLKPRRNSHELPYWHWGGTDHGEADGSAFETGPGCSPSR